MNSLYDVTNLVVVDVTKADSAATATISFPKLTVASGSVSITVHHLDPFPLSLRSLTNFIISLPNANIVGAKFTPYQLELNHDHRTNYHWQQRKLTSLVTTHKNFSIINLQCSFEYI
jgi:predicted secreted protein